MNEDNAQQGRGESREDREWVPRATYEMLMDKLNGVVAENQALAAENADLRRRLASSQVSVDL